MEVAAILAIILLDFPDFGLILGLLIMNATISYREEASADKVCVKIFYLSSACLVMRSVSGSLLLDTWCLTSRFDSSSLTRSDSALELTKRCALWQAIKALAAALAPKARAFRDGKLEQVDAAELVPGDIVLISIGNIVPADIKLLGEEGDDVPMQVSGDSSGCFFAVEVWKLPV